MSSETDSSSERGSAGYFSPLKLRDVTSTSDCARLLDTHSIMAFDPAHRTSRLINAGAAREQEAQETIFTTADIPVFLAGSECNWRADGDTSSYPLVITTIVSWSVK